MAAPIPLTPVQARSAELTDQAIREEECSICLEKMVEGRVYILACTHLFHEGCILQWNRQDGANSRKCPVCRADISDDGKVVRTIAAAERALPPPPPPEEQPELVIHFRRRAPQERPPSPPHEEDADAAPQMGIQVARNPQDRRPAPPPRRGGRNAALLALVKRINEDPDSREIWRRLKP